MIKDTAFSSFGRSDGFGASFPSKLAGGMGRKVMPPAFLFTNQQRNGIMYGEGQQAMNAAFAQSAKLGECEVTALGNIESRLSLLLDRLAEANNGTFAFINRTNPQTECVESGIGGCDVVSRSPDGAIERIEQLVNSALRQADEAVRNVYSLNRIN